MDIHKIPPLFLIAPWDSIPQNRRPLPKEIQTRTKRRVLSKDAISTPTKATAHSPSSAVVRLYLRSTTEPPSSQGNTSFVFAVLPLPFTVKTDASENETRPSAHPVTKTPCSYRLHFVQVARKDGSEDLPTFRRQGGTRHTVGCSDRHEENYGSLGAVEFRVEHISSPLGTKRPATRYKMASNSPIAGSEAEPHF